MALLFAAEIGDLEQVKSLVLSCEDRFGALAAGQPAVSARKNAGGGGAAARNNATSAPTSSPASSSTSAAGATGAAGAAAPAASSPKRNNKAEDAAAAGPTSAAPPGTPKAPNSSKTTAKTFEEAKLELVNGKDSKRGRTALIAAVGRGHFAVADFLLNVGADASAQDRDGVDVLMLASYLHGKRHSHTELVQLLLKHGADVSLVDRRAQSSLHYAAKRGCLGAVKLLLAQMAGEKMHLANRKDHKGRTALMIAAGRGHVNLVRSFCAHGVDVNLVDAHGWSALHHAARAGREEMVEVLLGNGANVATRDAHALTSLQIASALGHVSFVAELLYRNAILDPWQPPTGASWPEDPNVNHRSAILLAATNGHMVTLHVLLAHRLATALAEVASTTAASHSHEESRPPREERPVAKNAKGPPQPQEKESAPENSSAAFTSSTPPFASSSGAPPSSLHENTKFSDAEEAPMDAYTSLEAEIKEARRLAALSCHVDVVRFLGFCAGLQLPQDAHKIRFRAFCICSTCDAYYFKGGNQDNNSIRPTETATPAAVSVRAGAVRSPSLASAPLEIAEINQACEVVGAVDSSVSTAGAPGAAATAASMVATSAQQLANGMPGKIALPVSEPPPPQAGSHPGDMSNRNRSRSSSIATRDLIDIRSAVELVAESTSQRSARATTLSVAGSYRPHEREDGRGPRHAGLRKLERSFDPDQVFDPEDPRVKSDILRMIGMYLQEEGLMATTLTLQDEAQIKLQKRNEMNERAQHIKHLISIGDWPKIREIHVKPLLKRNRRRFLYALYRQEYLELVARGENERAFSFLSKRLKPLEAQGKYAVNSNEFRDLCYLLTCKSVHDAAAFRDWDVASARDKLAEEFESMIITQANSDEAALVSRQAYVAKDRLVNMLQQAVAYQLEFSSNTGPNVTPKIETLLEDFERVAVPQTLTNTFVGHTHNVKCVKFLGREGRLIASGSSDCTIMLWRVRDEAFDGSDAEEEDDEDDDLLDEDFAEETATGADANGGVNGHSLRHYRQRGPELVIRGHKSRIWDIASDNSGRFLVSASGDNTVRMWDVWACMEDNGLGAPEEAYLGKLSHYNGSTWTSPSDAWGSPLRGRGRSRSRHYQTTSEPLGRLHDQSASDHCLRTGHEGDIYTVAFQNDQEHIATAGYDKTVRLVNVRTNQLVRTFQGHRAAVSQVCFNPLGNLIVSVSKDSGIKFWDTISGVCVRTFNQPVGEVTSIDISRDGLQLLASSKDSSVRLWDVRMEKSIRKFRGYQNSSLNFVRSVFGPRESLVFSGSEDAKVHVWDTETGSLLAKLRGHNGPVFHAAWNSSQDTLATCSEDGTVRTWKNTRENTSRVRPLH